MEINAKPNREDLHNEVPQEVSLNKSQQEVREEGRRHHNNKVSLIIFCFCDFNFDVIRTFLFVFVIHIQPKKKLTLYIEKL